MIPMPLIVAKSTSAAQLNPSRESFDSSWEHALSLLLGEARSSGADFCEIFLERRNHLAVLVENKKVSAVSPTLSLGAGIRLFRGTKDCYVSTPDVTYAGLKWALDKALSLIGLSAPDASRICAPLQLEPLRDLSLLKNKGHWLKSLPTVEETVGVLRRINESIFAQTAHLESGVTSHFRDWQEVLVAASDGVFARDVRLTQSLVAGANCADGAHRSSVSERRGSAGQPDFLHALPAEDLLRELEKSARTMLKADFVRSGKSTLVMAGGFGGVIFHEACGHLLETTQIERQSTPFAEHKGQKIANEAVTAWDEGLTPGAFGTLDMDDEGMPTQSTLLIEKGILRNFISDRAGQLRTGHARTGSGRRQNHTFAAASRMRNTFIGAGPHTPQQLIESVDSGLYCKRMGGGSVGATGEFNFSVSEAYLIENGKLTKPVKGATLIGDAKEILMQISACANDVDLSPGFCGSISGSIYVTVGQPHIKVDGITVGGRSA
jgi:TldD protein